jgi:hypothetical protein
MMPRHRDLDFDHTSVWCDDCWDQEQRRQQTAELRRTNDLKQRELDLREWGESEPRREPRPRYILPPPPTPKVKGGMSVEPRRRSAG